ncbi:hypothetical protein D9Q98_005278 [Chlorella vulgaris]|uniref:Uncharacterized protein n=1 Tax=Chlorella vulgaris TaxID=3077 RepID=A0A9D4TP71_CHLVU|nr:hypothetical protein D9Q98_005278 [Chlorella vulgaris]
MAMRAGLTDAELAATKPPLITLQELQGIAQLRGLELSIRTLGPFYRIVCRDAAPASRSKGRRAPSSAERAAEEAAAGVGGSGRVLAVTSGFVVPQPVGLMHCDTLQVFTKGQTGEEGGRTRGGVMGLGLLMGAATFAHGVACGCRTAEILAINDDDEWHQRLVRYYGRFGFRTVRDVQGNSLADLPHMLVWGGAGTRMDADMVSMLRRWSTAIRRNSAAAALAGGGDSATDGETSAAAAEAGAHPVATASWQDD